ncbi:unnamed protein product [Linum tenue]|uniref:Partial AB-hydrolase lipase domain-containing protein n=1 Tax=Linum tenue TaxID=586396 RepID=A0AAV0M1M6_9ROSI|nr:unnamed protein product [Linum tenue]
MAKALISLVILSSLLCKFTVGTGRTTDLSAAINATAPAAAPFALSLGDDEDGGICDLLVTNQGYICEEHTVTTSDGYILSLQRIPVGISGGITPGKRTPVLLQHGVLMDGMTWLLLPPSLMPATFMKPVARRGTLAMYDYDDEYENMNHYGQPSPPEYSMTTIPDDFPLFFSYGGTDTLSDKSDVRILLDVLKGRDDSNGKFMTQYVNNYAHADYVMADAAKEEVYDLVLTFLKLH